MENGTAEAADDGGSSPKIQDIAKPGLKVPPDVARTLQREVANLLGRHQISFPGAQPVSFARRHLEELKSKDYYICEKSDGIRYLLYLTTDEHCGESQYLVDRKNEYWHIRLNTLHFPFGKGKDDSEFHIDTLIDGELVMESMGGGRREPKFLVFDCLVLDGNSEILTKSLDKRLGYIKENIMKPYKDLFGRFPAELQYQAFEVVMKDMQVAYGIEMMFREVLPSLRHGNDGLIFTCRVTPYQHGTDPHILKWKPSNENTVDFRIRLEFPNVEPDDEDCAHGVKEAFRNYDAVPAAHLYVFTGQQSGYKRWPENLYLAEDEWETLKSLGDPVDWRIIECALDEKGRWRLHRFRDDKLEANHVSTVESVMESIKEPVSERELMEAAALIKTRWKAREQQRRQLSTG